MKRSPRSYPRFSFRAGSVSDGGNAWLIVFLDFLLSQRMTGWWHTRTIFTIAHSPSSPSLQSGGPCLTFMAKNFPFGDAL